MNKISEIIASAFLRGERKKLSNSESTGDSVLLHGNCIAKKVDGHILFNTCGWQTRTTMARLNAILECDCRPNRIYQREFVWYYKNQPVPDGTWFSM